MKPARIISYLTNPVFILISLPYFLVYKATTETQTALFWTIYTFVFIFIFVIFVLLGIRKKLFTDIDVSVRKQRFVLYYTAFFLSIIYYLGLILLNAPAILHITIIGIIIGIVLGSALNTRIKTSVHVAAFSALVIALSLVYRGYFILLFALIPLIGWARVDIKRHTIPEVIAGGILGSLLSLFMYFTYRSFIGV